MGKKTKKAKKHSPSKISKAHAPHTFWIVTSTLLIGIAFLTSILLTLHMSQTSKEFLTRNGVEEEYNEQPGDNENVKGVANSNAIILHGDRSKKQIALTFDAEMTDGMRDRVIAGGTSYDSRIINTLNKTHTKATLFITGMWAQLYPDKVKTFAKNPLFEIGSHSYADTAFNGTCYGLSPTGDNQDLEQIMSTQKILKNLTGRDSKLFRFPGGCYDDFDIDVVSRQAHLTIVHWDVVGGDGFNDNTQSIVHAVVDTAKNGSIIVLHMNGEPTAPRTADALPDIISQLKTKGFQFVKVSELLGLH